MPADLYDCFSQQPEVEIIGVISAAGGLGSRGSSEDSWEMDVTLWAWRDATGVLREDELYVRAPMSEEAILRMQDVLLPFRILKLLLRMGGVTAQNRFEALLVQIVELDASDPDLETIAAELQKPVTLETERFGDLVYDRLINCYEGSSKIGDGAEVEICLEANDESDTTEVLSVAEQIWESIDELDLRAREYAQSILLDLKNTDWLEEDEDEEVTPQEFIDRISIRSLYIEKSGSFSIGYDDGDLFLGHQITVEGDLKGGFNRATI